MEVINGLDSVPSGSHSSLTVGSFDGLHLGHQRILRLMRASSDGLVTVLTFEPHPQSIVRPDVPPPPQLTTRNERVALFNSHGVDRLIFARFDRNFANLSAEEYVSRILVEKLDIAAIFIGPNHRFGKSRLGDADLLKRLGLSIGFQVNVVQPIIRHGEIASSSRIRKRLLAGDARIGLEYLSRPYYITNEVIYGEGRGRKLGFPTANFGGIEDGKLEPPPGIYASITELDGLRWPSVSHFGPRPTFTEILPAIETHIIGFDDNIYGKTIRVGLVEKLRDTVAFGSVSELIEQMELDRGRASEQIAAAGFKHGARLKSRRLGKIED
jgi:riboflavin kinase / FMN adenylyltransferase